MIKHTLLLLTIFIGYISTIGFAQSSSLNSKAKETIDTIEKLLEEEKYTDATLIINNTLPHASRGNDALLLAWLYYYKGNILETTTATDNECRLTYDTAWAYARKCGNIPLQLKSAGRAYFVTDPTAPEADAYRKKITALVYTTRDTTRNDYIRSVALYYSGKITNWSGDKGNALQYALRAYELEKKLAQTQSIDNNEICETLGSICMIYGDMQQPEKQLQYIREMRQYIDGSLSQSAQYYYYYSKNRNQARELKVAITYADSLKQVCNATSSSIIWNLQLDLDLAIAQACIIYKYINTARQYALDAEDIFKKYGYPYSEAQLRYTLGLVYYADNNFNEALAAFIQGSRVARGFNYQDLYLICIGKTAQCYAALGQWQKAYQVNDSLVTLKDSFYKIQTNMLFADAEEKYQNKEKQQQINIQHKQLSFAHKQRLWLIAGLLLAGGLLVLLIAFYRNKKRTADKLSKLNNELNEANQTKARLFSIIGHDLRSPISQVYQFLKLQQMQIAISEEEKNKLGEKVQKAAGSLLETMEELLLWSKSQLSTFTVNMQDTPVSPVIDQCQDLLKLNSDAKNITVANTIPATLSIKTDPYFLQIVIRNLLQNAIKAAPENTDVIISCNEAGKLSITNNGPVFSMQDYERAINNNEDKNLSGLGLKLVDELSRKINVAVSFLNPDDNTTQAVLAFS